MIVFNCIAMFIAAYAAVTSLTGLFLLTLDKGDFEIAKRNLSKPTVIFVLGVWYVFYLAVIFKIKREAN